jgi:hypothetical protein
MLHIVQGEEFPTVGQVSDLGIRQAVWAYITGGIVVEVEVIMDTMAADHIMEVDITLMAGIIIMGGVTHIRGGVYPQL